MRRKKLTKWDRELLYTQMNGRCAYCGINIEYKDMQVDHVVPLRCGGPDTLDNMVSSCRSCNHYKRGNSLAGFRKMIEAIPDTLERDSYVYRIGCRYGNVQPKKKNIYFYFETLEE